MKKIFSLLAISALLSPLSVLAQVSSYSVPQTTANNQGSTVTRAQVKQELAELEAAGYNPAADQIDYPNNLQKAQKIVWEKHHQK